VTCTCPQSLRERGEHSAACPITKAPNLEPSPTSALRTLVLCDCHAAPGDPRPDPQCPFCHGAGEIEVAP